MTKRQFFFDSAQGVDEIINNYTFDASRWGFTSLTAITAVIATNRAGDNVTTTIISGSGSISGTTITLPTIKSLTVGEIYRIELKFTSGGGTFEAFGYLYAEE
jgi:hypothetical protein